MVSVGVCVGEQVSVVHSELPVYARITPSPYTIYHLLSQYYITLPIGLLNLIYSNNTANKTLQYLTSNGSDEKGSANETVLN